MPDAKQVGRDAYQRVVDLVGTPKVCRVVDSQTRSLVADLLRQNSNATQAQADYVAGQAAREVKQVCTAMSPEGRTVVVLMGATAAVVYGILNYEELEPKVKDAIRKAKIPIKVPLGKVGVPGDLKLSVGLEELEASYRANLGTGRLDLQFQRDLGQGNNTYGLGYSGQVGPGRLNTRIEHTTSNNNTRFTGSYSGQAYGGTWESGVRYNTRSGDRAVFFEFRIPLN